MSFMGDTSSRSLSSKKVGSDATEGRRNILSASYDSVDGEEDHTAIIGHHRLTVFNVTAMSHGAIASAFSLELVSDLEACRKGSWKAELSAKRARKSSRAENILA
jgi:hypothetical protein